MSEVWGDLMLLTWTQSGSDCSIMAELGPASYIIDRLAGAAVKEDAQVKNDPDIVSVSL